MPGALVEAFEMVVVEAIPLAHAQRRVAKHRDGRVVSVDHLVMRVDKPHLRELRRLASSNFDRSNTAADLGARVTCNPTRVGRAATVTSARVAAARAAAMTARRAATMAARRAAAGGGGRSQTGQPKCANKST